MVSNRDTACAFRGLRPGWPLLVPWDCFSTTRDNPEERDAIEIEGDLIEIAGESDIARMDMIKDMICFHFRELEYGFIDCSRLIDSGIQTWASWWRRPWCRSA